MVGAGAGPAVPERARRLDVSRAMARASGRAARARRLPRRQRRSRRCANWQRSMRSVLATSARLGARRRGAAQTGCPSAIGCVAQGEPSRPRADRGDRGLALQSSELARMDYDFLYDKARHLLAIGYNVGEHRRDASYYDLLASEARLCSFVAIAQGQLPQESWFALGRLLTTAGGEPVLLSWSGSMFEYLMPLLVMPTYENTLLDQTYRAAVERQIEYGRQRGVPWGMSECGYNTVDVQLNYQYRAFGVPGLGLKRGLAEDLVIAPYASALALMVAPEAACANLQRLARRGTGRKVRLVRGHRLHAVAAAARAVERHGPLVHGASPGHEPAVARLSASRPPDAEAIRVGPAVPGDPAAAAGAHPEGHGCFIRTPPSLSDVRATAGGPEMPVRVLTSPDTPVPEVQLLSNGRYHVMVTNAGGGNSRWKDLAVTRWREDAHLRQLGHVLLPPRRGERGVLVDRASADAQAGRALRGDLLGRPGGVPPPRHRFRDAHRDRRFARRRHRAAPRPHHQPLADTPDDRRHELRRGGSRAAGRGRDCIRRSAISSCRPRSSRSGRPFFARAGHAPSTSRRRGCFT